MVARIRVAAIDDDTMLLEGMVRWFARLPDIRLVATSPTVDAHLCDSSPADVVLLDLNLRDDSDPVANVRRLVANGSRVLIVSVAGEPEYVMATVEAGARGYITKRNDLSALVEAITSVMAGEFHLSSELAFLFSRDHRPRRPDLSPREREMLVLYASGMTLESAARRMSITPGTARTYLARIKRKYADMGRPASTKLDLGNRLREDRLSLEGRP